MSHPSCIALAVCLTVAPAHFASTALGQCVESGATDLLPATGMLVLDVLGDAVEPFVLRLSSSDRPDTTIDRATQVGSSIDTEILQMELGGNHPTIGAVVLRESPSLASTGLISNIVQTVSCDFVGASAFFDVFVELDVTAAGETWVNIAPIRVAGVVTSLPHRAARLERPSAVALTLVDQVSGQPRAELLYQRLTIDPAYPPAGSDCFDVQLTADIDMVGPGSATTISGGGTATVTRGAPLPRLCTLSSLPCADDSDCSGLGNVCGAAAIETEIVQLDVAGTDPLLGTWQLQVLPAAGDSDCCNTHATPGCSDQACADEICVSDPFCCQTEWDDLCATRADSSAICAPNCADPDLPASAGTTTSQGGRTYPADAELDFYLQVQSELQGDFRNPASNPIVLEDTPITNTPPDPGTTLSAAPAVPLERDDGTPVGDISNVHHVLQLPRDCDPPPGAGSDCLAGTLEVRLDLPGCSPETLTFGGTLRVLRDAPVDPSSNGREQLATLLTQATFGATSGCAGPLVFRLDAGQASAGVLGSFAPEEFFPAATFFDVFFELDTSGGTLHGGPLHLATTVNTWPPAVGKVYLGPTVSADLLDTGDADVGDLGSLRVTIDGPTGCVAGSAAEIRFLGPTRDDLTLRGASAGGGAVYDLVRGDLGFLRQTGSFITTQCEQTDGGPTFNDPDTPAPGDGFYYAAREGLGAYDGTWNSTSAQQQADRDPVITTPPCP